MFSNLSDTILVIKAKFNLLSANAIKMGRSTILAFNLLPHMPTLGSSNSAGNEDMMGKIWTDGNTNICLSRKLCGKSRNCSLRTISPFPTMFSKAGCCSCVKMSIYEVKG